MARDLKGSCEGSTSRSVAKLHLAARDVDLEATATFRKQAVGPLGFPNMYSCVGQDRTL